jgi:hypothetical protein
VRMEDLVGGGRATGLEFARGACMKAIVRYPFLHLVADESSYDISSILYVVLFLPPRRTGMDQLVSPGHARPRRYNKQLWIPLAG